MNPLPANKKDAVKYNFRYLYRNFFTWLAAYVIDTACDLGNSEYILGRIDSAVEEIAAEFGNFYGYENKLEFLNIHRDIIKAFENIFTSIKKGDEAKARQYTDQWRFQVDKLCAFLSSININWSAPDLRGILNSYITLSTNTSYCSYLVQPDKETAINDVIENASTRMADFISTGIIKQKNIM